MLHSMLRFIGEFSPLEQGRGGAGPWAGKKDKGSKRRSDVVTGVGLEPACVFSMLLGLQEDTFKVVEGRQEDAEEFLTCLLNGLSDEMTEQIKLAGAGPAEQEEQAPEEEGEDWQEVGARGRSCVTRRVAGTDLPVTPIQVGRGGRGRM